MPDDVSYEALLDWTLEQGDIELPLKDLIAALMETFVNSARKANT